MSFDDFIDLVNPLQHIPIASSIYRAVTGETINPLSRIAGDALYGGVFGLASAGLSALGAVGDEIFKATTGESASTMVVAALFGDDGDDKDAPVQLASADAPADNTTTATTATTPVPTVSPGFAVAALQTPARQSPILDMPDLGPGTASPALLANATDPHASTLTYGEVQDTAIVQNALQAQALALSLASGHDAMQAQHALHSNRLATGSSVSPLTPTTRQAAALPLPGETPMLSGAASQAGAAQAGTNATNPAASLANLQSPAAMSTASSFAGGGLSRSTPSAGDLRSIKGIDSYRRSAQGVPVMGSAVSLAN